MQSQQKQTYDNVHADGLDVLSQLSQDMERAPVAPMVVDFGPQALQVPVDIPCDLIDSEIEDFTIDLDAPCCGYRANINVPPSIVDSAFVALRKYTLAHPEWISEFKVANVGDKVSHMPLLQDAPKMLVKYCREHSYNEPKVLYRGFRFANHVLWTCMIQIKSVTHKYMHLPYFCTSKVSAYIIQASMFLRYFDCVAYTLRILHKPSTYAAQLTSMCSLYGYAAVSYNVKCTRISPYGVVRFGGVLSAAGSSISTPCVFLSSTDFVAYASRELCAIIENVRRGYAPGCLSAAVDNIPGLREYIRTTHANMPRNAAPNVLLDLFLSWCDPESPLLDKGAPFIRTIHPLELDPHVSMEIESSLLASIKIDGMVNQSSDEIAKKFFNNVPKKTFKEWKEEKLGVCKAQLRRGDVNEIGHGENPHDITVNVSPKTWNRYLDRLKLYDGAHPKTRYDVVRRMVDKHRTEEIRTQRNLKCAESLVSQPFENQGLTDMFRDLLKKGGNAVAEGFTAHMKAEVSETFGNIGDMVKGLIGSEYTSLAVYLPGLIGWAWCAYKCCTVGFKTRWGIGLGIVTSYLLTICPLLSAYSTMLRWERSWHMELEDDMFVFTPPKGKEADTGSPRGAMKNQGGANPLDLENLSRGIAIITTFFTIGSASGDTTSVLTKIMRSIGEFPKFSDGLVSFFHTVLQTVELVVNKIRVYFGMDKVEMIEKEFPRFNAWLEEARAIIDLSSKQLLDITRENFDRVYRCRMEGFSLMDTFAGKSGEKLRSNHSIIMNQLNKVASAFEQFNWNGAGIRREPYALRMFSGPGTGKSTILIPICMELWARVKSPEEYQRMLRNVGDVVYCWQSENEYASNYMGQGIFCIDDGNQAKPVPGFFGDDFIMMRAKNPWPWIMHMAELSLKGRVEFKSEFILWTTNVRKTSDVAINCPEAIERRFDWTVLVSVNPEYARNPDAKPEDRRLDLTKLKEWKDPRSGTVIKGFDPNVYEFYTMQDGYPKLDQKYDYFTFMDSLEKRYVAHYQRMTNLLGAFTSYGENLKAIKESEGQIQFFDAQTVLDPPPSGTLDLQPEKKKKKDKKKSLSVTGKPFESQGFLEEMLEYWKTGKKPAPIHITEPIPAPLRKHLLKVYDADVLHELNKSHRVLDEVQLTEPPNFWKEATQIHRDTFVKICCDKQVPFHFILMKHKEFFEENKVFTESLDKFVNFIEVIVVTEKINWQSKGTPMESCVLVPVEPGFFGVFDRLKQSVINIKESITEWVKKHPVLTAVIAALPILLAASSIYVWLATSDDKIENQGAGESGSADPKKDGKKENRRIPFKSAQAKEMRNQEGPVPEKVESGFKPLKEMVSQWDPTAEDFALSLARDNLLRVFLPGCEKSVGMVLCVKANLAICPRHICEIVRECVKRNTCEMSDTIELATIEGSIVRMKAMASDFVEYKTIPEWEKNDLCMIQFKSRGFPPRKDILTRTAEKDHNRFFEARQFAIERDWTAALLVARQNAVFFVTVPPEDIKFHESVKVSNLLYQYIHGGAFVYTVPTKHGDCGGVLMVLDKRTRQKKIIGMHIAGNGDTGMSSALCYEDILEVAKQFTVRPEDSLAATYGQANQGAFCNDKFTVVREVKNPATTVGVSEIVPSKLIDTYTPHITAPAVLSPFVTEDGKRVDPMLKALERYGEPAPSLSNEDEKAITTCVNFEVAKSLKVVGSKAFTPRVLTDEEAVLGVSPWLKPIPTDTSPGWPHEHERKAGEPGKTHWFGHNGIDMNHPECIALLKRVHEKEELMKQGIPVEFVFKDFPKDERRKLSRVAAGETRLISGSDLELLILFRKYFGAYLIAYVQGKIHNGSAIGANPHGIDWDVLYRLLDNINIQKLIAGDFIGMDTSTIRQIMMALGGGINTLFYKTPPSHPEAQVRMMLLNAIARSVHIYKNVVYLWHRAFPSGCPITALLNTLYLGVVFRWVFWRCGGKKPYLFNQYDEDVYMCRLGDDHVGAVAERSASFFNMITIEATVPIIGMKYADANKNPVKEPFMKLSDVTFLKRSFRYEPLVGRFIGTLDLKTVLEMPQWTKRGSQKHIIELANFDTAMLYLSMHDDAVFNEWAPKMISAYQEAYHHPYAMTDRHDLVLRATDMDVAIGASGLEGVVNQCLLPPAMTASFVREVTSRIPRRVGVSRRDEGLGFGSYLAQPVESVPTTQTLGQIIHSQGVMRITDHVNTNSSSSTTPSEQSATTTFETTQTAVKAEVRPMPTEVPDVISSGVTEHTIQGIRDFLQKPVILTSGTVSASDVGTIGLPIVLPTGLISNAMYQAKLQGFQLMRGTVKIKLQMNGNMFQQGLYMLVFIPGAGITGVNTAIRLANLQTVTQLPRAMLNLATDSEVELRIPWVSPTAWHNLLTGDGIHGSVYFYVYSALATGTGGGSTVGYTIWGSFDSDLELANPTKNPTPVAPPMRMVNQSRVSSKVFKKRNIQDAEVSDGAGPITRMLDGLSHITRVAKNIPLIADIAGPSDWAINIMKGAASAAGWSKPLIKDIAQFQNVGSYIPMSLNMDGMDHSINFGLSNDSKLDECPGVFGTKEDEMSFEYVQQVFAMFDTFDYTTSNLKGQLIYSTNLSPLTFRSSQTDGSVTYFNYTPYAFMGRLWNLWHGPFVLRVIKVGTGLQQGRLCFSFFPGVDKATAPTLDDTAYVVRKIVDVSKATQWDFEIPFCAATQWLSTGSSVGCFTVHVVNEMVAPDTVAGATHWFLEVAGTPESRWASLSDNLFSPYMPSTMAALSRRHDHKGKNPTYVAPYENQANPAAVPSTLALPAKEKLTMGTSIETSGLTAARYCIGELATSFRQLVKMYRRVYTGTLTQAQLQDIVFRPFSIGFVTSNGSGVVTMVPLSFDLFSLISAMYAFRRGGVRFYNSTGASNAIMFAKAVTTANAVAGPMVASSPTTYGPYGDNETAYNTNGSVQSPGYMLGPCTLTRFAYTGHNEPQDLYSYQVNFELRCEVAPTDYRLWRAAGDDYSCGYFLGIPPIIESATLPALVGPEEAPPRSLSVSALSARPL